MSSREGVSAGAHKHSSDPKTQPADVKACQQAAAIFGALGDLNRLRILSLLAQREMCVSEITAVLSDNLSAISQRLRLLKGERIVVARREGKHMFYSLVDKHVRNLVLNGLDHGKESTTPPS